MITLLTDPTTRFRNGISLRDRNIELPASIENPADAAHSISSWGFIEICVDYDAHFMINNRIDEKVSHALLKNYQTVIPRVRSLFPYTHTECCFIDCKLFGFFLYIFLHPTVPVVEFVWIYAPPRRIWDRPIFFYTNRFIVIFWVHLSLSVFLSKPYVHHTFFCPSYRAQFFKYYDDDWPKDERY